ncbi:MAG: 3-phosphoshikimate 1-carboxyvinyltransferase [Acidobacteriota bacterium]
MLIKPARTIRGELKLPGDKSISHRAAMIASLANGRTAISNYAESADCASTISCLRALGVPIERRGTNIFVDGVGRQGLKSPTGPLDCGNSGTTMRLMTGVLACQSFESELIGDASLSKRPMKRVIDPMGFMGITVESVDGHAPLHVHGNGSAAAAEHTLAIASAQIKSCILLAGLNAAGTTIVNEPTPTRDHTERMLRWFGSHLTSVAGKISLRGGQELTARDLSVPCDISGAAFFLVAAASLPGSGLTLINVGLNPTRTGIIEVLTRLGVDLTIQNERIECNEPVGDIIVRGGTSPLGSDSNVIDGSLIANLIDEIPILAVLGTQLHAGLEVRDAAELRVKESDRITSIIENLRRMGAAVEEFPDGFRVAPSQLTGAPVDSFDDHRIAMAFAVAGLLARGDTEIERAECVDISFPGFFETLAGVILRGANS